MTLNVYMKSGNKIKLGGIKDYEFKMQGGEVMEMSLVMHPRLWFPWRRERVLAKTLDLSQIEAVTVG